MNRTLSQIFTAIGLNHNKDVPLPNKLFLRIIRRCNFNCKYCFTRLFTDIHEGICYDIVPQHAQNILQDAWTLGCREVHLGGQGEPSLHPNFYQFLSYAKDIGYSITFTSNGSTLNPEKMGMLDKKDLIRISVDNMHLNGSPHPKEYIKHLDTFFIKSKTGKFKTIAVTHGKYNSKIKSMLKECNVKVIRYPLFKEPLSISDPKGRRSFFLCPYPYHSISIDSDLSVNPCPCSSELKVGQITDQEPLKDIWYGERLQNFREEMYSENPPKPCKMCDKWNRGSIEWFNAYLRSIKAYR